MRSCPDTDIDPKYVPMPRPNEPDLSQEVPFGIYCTPPNSTK